MSVQDAVRLLSRKAIAFYFRFSSHLPHLLCFSSMFSPSTRIRSCFSCSSCTPLEAWSTFFYFEYSIPDPVWAGGEEKDLNIMQNLVRACSSVLLSTFCAVVCLCTRVKNPSLKYTFISILHMCDVHTYILCCTFNRNSCFQQCNAHHIAVLKVTIEQKDLR